MASGDFDPWTAIVEHDSPELERYREALPEVGAAPDAVLLGRYDARDVEVHVRTGAPALLVLTDSWDPGWSASVRAEEDPGGAAAERAIERVDHHFRGVWLEPGHWLVRFRYDPASTRVGLWVAAGAVLALVALARRRAA